MNDRPIIFQVLLVFCFFCAHINAAAYYVDSDVPASGDGTSWSTAWKNFADINWSSIAPGDTIYISGGTVSKSYHEKLTVSASGAPGNPVVITKGRTPGHNGNVILDGQMSLDSGIYIENYNDIVVQQLTVKNYTGGGQIRVRNSTGVIVDNNEIYVTGHGGVYLRGNTNTIVRNNRISTPTDLAAQTDGIYSQLNTGDIYENNHIVIRNNEVTGHDDGIQMYQVTDITIRGNYIEQDNNKTENAQGIYCTESFGTIRVYNNIVYGPNTKNSLLTLRTIASGNATLIASHNTLYGGGWGTIMVENSPGSVVQNNCLINNKLNGWIFRLDGAITHPGNINHNLYYAPNSSIIATKDGSSKTFSEWQSLGYEANGMNKDPLFKDVANRDFTLTPESPAIDAGVVLPAPFNVDRLGTPRPQGSASDLGAYELILSSTPPAPPANFRLLE